MACAGEAAVLIRKIFKNGDLGVIDKGGLKNFQTEGDRAVQRLIATTLAAKFPDVKVIGEEDGDDGQENAEKNKVIEKLDESVMGKTFPENLQNVAADRVSHVIPYCNGTFYRTYEKPTLQ